MKLYHGTTEANLTELYTISRDREGKPVLYLTDNRAYSLFYIRDREIDFVTCGVDSSGIVHYDEKFENQLKLLYQGISGYIYETQQEAESSKINGIYLCRSNVPITKAEYIADAYDAIVQEIEKGSVNVLPYHCLTDEQKKKNHDGIVQYLRNFSLNAKRESFIRTYFPAAWQEALEDRA